MTKTRLEYIDALKFLAILGIVFIHVSAIWPDAEILHINIRNTTQLLRWGVPVFVMISGALLLNREMDLKSFFKKRFVRVCYPMIFFIIISDILTGSYDFFSAYWYCWMILGAFLAIPIINKFILNSTDEEIKYYVYIFLIASFIYQAAYAFNIRFALDINFFITPVSYLVLGYYLSKKEFAHPIWTILIAIALFLITSVIKYHTGSFMHFYAHEVFSSRLDIGIVQIIQASCVFIIVKLIYSENINVVFSKIKGFLQISAVSKFILSVSRASYGMYLIQFFYRDYAEIVLSKFSLTGSQVFGCFMVLSVVVFLISWISILILSRIPFINKFSGYA